MLTGQQPQTWGVSTITLDGSRAEDPGFLPPIPPFLPSLYLLPVVDLFCLTLAF